MGEPLTQISVADGYRLWSVSYDRDPNPLLALEMRLLRERLEPLAGRTVIDVATGTGRWMKYAASHGARAIGLDISPHMLAAAANPVTPRLVLADMRSLPFRGASADMAICSFALGYLSSPAAALREMARIARRVIVTDLHPAAVEAGWKRAFRRGGESWEFTHYVHSPRDLDEAAAAAGLKPEWEIESGFGEPERAIFEAAGKPDLFFETRSVNAIFARCWTQV
jgi:SAM-dependent methyltransferase